MSVTLVDNVARPLATALSLAFSADTYGKLDGYGILGAADPDAAIKALFASGEQGAWYDPSDLTTMFQDRIGTTPVTADGQTVGKILDKSGNDNHAVAPNDAARPLYKTDGTYHWLQFDGVDDVLSTAAIDFTATNKMSVFIGVRKNEDTRVGSILQLGTNTMPVGGFGMWMGSPTSGPYPGWASTYNPASNVNLISAATYPAPQSIVHTTILSQTVADIELRLNSVVAASGVTAGPSAYANQVLQMSRTGGNGLIGNIYHLIVLGRLATTQEITDTETWVAAKTGVTLP